MASSLKIVIYYFISNAIVAGFLSPSHRHDLEIKVLCFQNEGSYRAEKVLAYINFTLLTPDEGRNSCGSLVLGSELDETTYKPSMSHQQGDN